MTIDPKQATGKLYSLWVSFAKFYESNGDLENARKIFEKAVKVDFKTVDELANMWCEYGEMELRNEFASSIPFPHKHRKTTATSGI